MHTRADVKKTVPNDCSSGAGRFLNLHWIVPKRFPQEKIFLTNSFSSRTSMLLPLLLFTLAIVVTPFGLTMTSRSFALNAKFSILPERRNEFIAMIKNDQTKTLTEEPLSLQFTVGEDTTNPNTFYLHEQYNGEEGFTAHCETAHFREWVAFCETEPFAEGGEVDLNFYWGSHEPTKVSPAPAFCLNIDLFPKPEVREAFLDVIAKNKKGSDDDEPLCLQYVYGENKDTSNSFHFHEEYTGLDGGKEGFDKHTTAPHFAAWEEFAGTDPFTKPPVVSFYTTDI